MNIKEAADLSPADQMTVYRLAQKRQLPVLKWGATAILKRGVI
jgi:hypothetical protein